MDMDTMMMQGPVPNKETESAHIFEELENNVVLANHWSEVKNKPWQIAFEPAMTIDKYIHKNKYLFCDLVLY